MTSEKRRQLKEQRIYEALNSNKPCDCSDCGGKELRAPCLDEIREEFRKKRIHRINQKRMNQNILSRTSPHQYYVNPTFNKAISSNNNSKSISSSGIGSVNVRISVI